MQDELREIVLAIRAVLQGTNPTRAFRGDIIDTAA